MGAGEGGPLMSGRKMEIKWHCYTRLRGAAYAAYAAYAAAAARMIISSSLEASTWGLARRRTRPGRWAAAS